MSARWGAAALLAAATLIGTPAVALAEPPDYTGLLIRAGDIGAPEGFTASAPVNNADGRPGATTAFRNPGRAQVIYDSIQVLPDPGAAVRALESATATTDGYVHGVPDPIPIGTGGTTISGPSPDGSKSVTVLMFAEGKAFAELEFDGPPDAPVSPDLVTDVGRKQDAAIRNGLSG
ncbi:hypothetical protein [Mycobacterium sp. 1081908.1]|uniref:hypothetical protein n=1 Tax=Mycobacterium sp. 1081908.1 TaxID=1834066 RepID=UPI000A52077E|nr:hypothetical protein [Mycobacterium sp. 1081908.1]